VDFSDASLGALPYATSLARESAAELVLLHVIEVPPEVHEFPLSALAGVESVRAAAEKDCLQRLRELVAREARHGWTVETSVREGIPYREILKVASENKTDLVVMGVQGRGAVDLIIFGSNTARVSRAATCPVLIVRK
jgi:nucleotide-binding universal stress UspA family protein